VTSLLIPLLQREEGLGEEAPQTIDAAGNLLSLTLSSQWRRGDPPPGSSSFVRHWSDARGRSRVLA